MQTIRAYYMLTKPGIIRGNALHALAGALLASSLPINWSALIGVLIGTSFVIASACVVNNYMDRGIDARMKRTSKRPSVTGVVSLQSAMIYAVVLFIIGFGVLYAWTNLLVMLIGLIAYISYVVLYGWAKRTTVYSTLVGAIPGALPAMAGYVAIEGAVAVGAWLVFMLIFVWQMPHFYAISLFRKNEYRHAKLPVLGAVRSFGAVRRHILSYLVVYAAVVSAIITFRTVGVVSGAILLAGAAYWMIVCIRTSTKDHDEWARSVFGASLVLSLLLVVSAVFNVFIPPYL